MACANKLSGDFATFTMMLPRSAILPPGRVVTSAVAHAIVTTAFRDFFGRNRRARRSKVAPAPLIASTRGLPSGSTYSASRDHSRRSAHNPRVSRSIGPLTWGALLRCRDRSIARSCSAPDTPNCESASRTSEKNSTLKSSRILGLGRAGNGRANFARPTARTALTAGPLRITNHLSPSLTVARHVLHLAVVVHVQPDARRTHFFLSP